MGSRLEKNSESVRKRIEAHTFENEEGDEYEGSKFGGFTDYFRRKKIKLQNRDADVRSASSGKPQIFRGIVAHVNGYTQPSLNDLHTLIVSHGGGFMQYLDGKTTVTHIIAANLTPKKAIEFRRYRIVKPAWVVDSVKAGRLLPWDGYKVIDEGVGQKLLGFADGKMASQVNTQQRTYKEQTTTSWYTSQVQGVAENIDAEEGAQFPSTQRVSLNGTGAYFDSAVKVKQWNENNKSKLEEPQNESLPSSANFDATSSLEDALNDAAKGADPAQEETVNIAPVPRAFSVSNLSSPVMTPEHVKPKRPVPDVQERTGFESPLHEELLTRDDYNSSPSRKGKEKERELTAEEHNARLLMDPHMRKSSTANPDFIQQYYSESRLHHLSMWKSDLKARFQQMASEKSASQKKPTKRKPGARRYILHVDFDSFFCAVSLKSAPEYVDKPTVVAHSNGPGSEIASCNYPARAFGIKNGMWMKKALSLCSDIKVLPYDFPAYEEASKGFYECILDTGGIVQSVSIDEALVDISAICLPVGGSDGVGVSEGSIWREQEKADQMASVLREKIKERTGCAVSVGIGGNILLAKVALRKAKPAGQHQIKPEDVLDFIGELVVQDLPGVAWSIGGKLEELGVKLVKDVRQLTKERLITVLGPKTGEKLWEYSRGIDRAEVGEQVVRKSVSAEVNWGIRFISQPEAEEFVQNLCKELQRRLLEQRVKGRQLTMKIMRKSADAPMDPPKNLGHGKCDTFNKSVVLGVATNNADVIGKEAVSILRGYGFSPGELRGLGVQMQKLELLKVSSDVQPDGSQRRINFAVSAAPKVAKQVREDPIDDPQTPTKPKINAFRRLNSGFEEDDPIAQFETPQKAPSVAPRFISDKDSIDDIESPQKLKYTPIHPAAAIYRANAADQSAKKYLNLTGTQFVIPTQIDPSVLAELPPDIRSQLLAQSKRRPASRPVSRARSESPLLRSSSPLVPSRSRSPEEDIFPSQLDPEVFSALPEDMKAEVLANYRSQHHVHHPVAAVKAQTILPQSPRKQKSLPPPKKWTPTKKRGRPPGSRNKSTLEANSGYKQSSFATQKKAIDQPHQSIEKNEENISDIIDEEFLAALPEDVRAEILAEHRRTRLLKKGVLLGLSKKRAAVPSEPHQNYNRKLRLPPREPRPTFTTQELTTLPELRETLRVWFKEFEEDGPHEDDVGAIERYFRRVIVDERDVGKVVACVRWLGWLISEASPGGGKKGRICGDDNDDNDDSDEIDDNQEGLRVWNGALEGIKEKVQEAVQERGLGSVEF